MAEFGTALATAAGLAGLGAFGLGVATEYSRPFKRSRQEPSTPVYHMADAGGGPAGQLVQRNNVYGRPKNDYRRKLLRRSYVHSTLLFQGVKNFGSSGTGVMDASNLRFFRMTMNEQSPVAGTTIKYPLYIFDVTQREYTTAVGAPLQNVCHRLIQSSAAPNRFDFTPVGGQPYDNYSSTNNYMQPFRTQGTRGELAGAGVSVLRDVTVDLLLQGAQGINSWFEVMFLQFLDENLLPTVGGNDHSDKFWEHMIKPCVGHPFASVPKDQAVTGRIRVLRRFKYRIAPDSTTNEATSTPGQVMAKLKINLNRTCNWNWSPHAPQDVYGSVNDPAVYKPIEDEMNPDLVYGNHLNNPKARVYMIIRAGAYNTSTTADDSYDSRSFPSFDMRMFCHHITMNQNA